LKAGRVEMSTPPSSERSLRSSCTSLHSEQFSNAKSSSWTSRLGRDSRMRRRRDRGTPRVRSSSEVRVTPAGTGRNGASRRRRTLMISTRRSRASRSAMLNVVRIVPPRP
jgi:hypothetical protein